MNNVQTLWNDYGVRLFVEVGPGDTLSNLIADTLPEPTCIQTCLPSAEGLTYRTALAQLFVQGHLKVEGEPKFVPLPAFRQTPDSAPVILKQASPAPGEASEHQDLMERLIRIIMDATGFNRDEIQPDMDLRRDLSIRSSRLPIIMDAAERQFGITIELEDFINVRTVKDIAQRISKIIARQGGPGLQPTTMAVDPGPVRDDALKPSEDGASLKRLVLNHATVQLAASIPVE
jgi:acyl carrier protein